MCGVQHSLDPEMERLTQEEFIKRVLEIKEGKEWMKKVVEKARKMGK